MKKLVSYALVLTMLLSLVGCSKSSGFSSDKKKMISALEKCCEAEEMSEKQKKKIIKNNMEKAQKYFDGSYVTLTADDIESMDIDDEDSEVPTEAIENWFMFQKTEGNSSFQVNVIELKDKEDAEKVYKTIKKSMKSMKKVIGEDNFTMEENDGKLMYMYEVSKSMSAYGYSEVNGKEYISIAYGGNPKDDLYDEFCEFLSECKYTDFEEFMEGDEKEDDEDVDDEEEDDEEEDD